MSTIPPHAILLDTAVAAATEAGNLIRRKLTEPRRISSKGYRDLVTDADLAAQALITDLIRDRFPDHGFLVEEEDGRLPTAGPVVWIVDPVDGTSNYSRQQPIFAVCIGALARGEVVAGAVYDPMRDEMFSAVLGQGSRLNGRPIHVSQTAGLEDAIVGLDWSRTPRQRQAMLATLGGFAHQVKTIRAIGSAGLAMAWIAAGRLDAYLNYSLGPWDLAGPSLIVAEAGGRVTDNQGRSLRFQGSTGGLASNGRLHDTLLPLMIPVAVDEMGYEEG